jgi:hypothetical protein
MSENRPVQAIPATLVTHGQTKIDEARTLLSPYIWAPCPGKTPISDTAALGTDFSDPYRLWTVHYHLAVARRP